MTLPEPRPVDAIVAGAQKAGTTSLVHYLEQHPDVCGSGETEMRYFVDDEWYEAGYETSYREHFGACARPGSVLLAKNVMALAEDRIAARLQRHNPAMHLILVLRDPVLRAYSAFWYARAMGSEEDPSFERALRAGADRFDRRSPLALRTRYLELGHYDELIDRARRYFPDRQVHVYLTEDLDRDPEAVCRSLFEALGHPGSPIRRIPPRNVARRPRSRRLAAILMSPHPVKRMVRRLLPISVVRRVKDRLMDWNSATFRPPPMEPATRAWLVEYYAPHNQRLAEMLGRDLGQWDGRGDSRADDRRGRP